MSYANVKNKVMDMVEGPGPEEQAAIAGELLELAGISWDTFKVLKEQLSQSNQYELFLQMTNEDDAE